MRMPDEATLLETLKCEKGCLGGLNTLLVGMLVSIIYYLLINIFIQFDFLYR